MPGIPMPENAAGSALRRIHSLLRQAMSKERAYVGRKLKALLDERGSFHHHGDPRIVLETLTSLEKRLEESIREKEKRIRRLPALRYPQGLPILSRRHDIVRAIKDHQVVIISGETGCGKSTQIPKMCLEAGRGAAGKIACTQPRRIAAITIAHRIAEELCEPLGRSVGYKIRFQDRTSGDIYIKVMTDGMLLAETQADSRLYDYDTLLIDEAHERSLNIDFLLGIARNLLDTRPELKMIITSATLDTEKFSKAFGQAPVIQVGGRMYPVEVKYQSKGPFSRTKDNSDYIDLAAEAIQELKSQSGPGDILIFMPTEQDILEICERLEGKHYPGTTVLPLYARLPAARQGRVYSARSPKIVVATNVAETSLTIPGIVTVIDTGLARISQYLPGTRINSLPVSSISKASADQRMGRCGRIQEGLCIRLYSREDYEARPEFTPPEILRSNLAEVILRMIDLRLGHPSKFPFVDAPPPKSIKDGFETLLELDAIKKHKDDYVLTRLGCRMARMPFDPRISRMLLEAENKNCLREVAIIASALSIRDPRERPPDQTAAADAKQVIFRHRDSDFLSLLNIWDQIQRLNHEPGSRTRLKKFCQEYFLSYPRIREWGFVHDQVLSILEDQKIDPGRKARVDISEGLYAAIHQSILSGFLSNIATHKEKNTYTAARGREIMIFPGSVLFGKSAPWIVAAEMVQTSRLFARTAAKIDPAWLEELGGGLCRHSYSDARWDRTRGEVRAKEKVTLYGLEIIAGRDVPYGPIFPEEAHEIFIRSALVEGNLDDPPPFLKHNLALINKVAGIEEKLRRRDILVNDKEIASFYSAKLAGLSDLRGLRQTILKAGGDMFLRLSEKDLMRLEPEEEKIAGFPDEVDLDGRRFKAAYKFIPGDESDGLTLKVPALLIKGLPSEPLEWGVPGQYAEKITALIKGLPKRYRKLLMPAAEKAEIIVREMASHDPSLFNALAGFVKRRFQVEIPAAEWARAEIPLHLKMRVAVIDRDGREIAAARNLDILRKASFSSAEPVDSPAWTAAQERWERLGIQKWDFGRIPESVAAGFHSVAFPGFEASDKAVNLRLFKSRQEALASHLKGVMALLLPRFAKDLEFVKRYLALPEEYESVSLFFGGRATIMKALTEALKREALQKNVRSAEDLEALASHAVKDLFEKGTALRALTLQVLDAYRKVRQAPLLSETTPADRRFRQAPGGTNDKIRAELQRLAPANFLELYRLERLRHLPRYLDALSLRAERAKFDPEKDRKKEEQITPFEGTLERISRNLDKEATSEKRQAIDDFRWMVEEFRVSLFAPELKTAFPISSKRLAAKIKEIESMV